MKVRWMLLICALKGTSTDDRINKDLIRTPASNESSRVDTQTDLLQTPGNICKGQSVFQKSNSFVFELNFKKFWYPWLHKAFPKCWESLNRLLCLKPLILNSKINTYEQPCRKHCLIAAQACNMVYGFSKDNADIRKFFSCGQYDNSISCNVSHCFDPVLFYAIFS